MGEDSKSFKVQDRRRFDADGNEVEEKAIDIDAKSSNTGPAEVAASVEPAGAEPSEHSIDFSSFIMSLATQALMQLGQMKAPPGVDIKTDREAARQTIDILSLLQLKTKGNLDKAEQQLFEEILHSLRMAYVRTK